VEERLRTTIIAGLVPTLATGLAGISGVNLDHADTICLGFVLDKRVQLGKAPTMQASFVLTMPVLFPSAHLGRLSNVLEVFKYDGTARSSMLYNAFGEHVVMISASPKLFATQLSEVFLSRAAAFGLLWRWLQLHGYRSVQAESISKRTLSYQQAQVPLCPSLKKGAALSSPGMNAGVSRADFDDKHHYTNNAIAVGRALAQAGSGPFNLQLGRRQHLCQG
jgi:hypothetical protein